MHSLLKLGQRQQQSIWELARNTECLALPLRLPIRHYILTKFPDEWNGVKVREALEGRGWRPREEKGSSLWIFRDCFCLYHHKTTERQSLKCEAQAARKISPKPFPGGWESYWAHERIWGEKAREISPGYFGSSWQMLRGGGEKSCQARPAALTQAGPRRKPQAWGPEGEQDLCKHSLFW